MAPARLNLSRTRLARLVGILLLTGLAGCSGSDRFAAFPETGAPGDYPALQPIDALLAQADGASADPGPAVAARAAQLKARAAALGAP
jgi:hypothetical protein